MSFGQAVATCFRKYAVFGGRATRAEYWYFVLFSYLLSVVVVVIAVVMSDPASRAASKADSPALVSLWVLSLILLLPSWAVLVRRLHDTDRPGWFVLIVLIPVLGAVVLLVTLASRGTEGPNHYGPDPSGSSKPASLWVSWPPRTCPFCAAMIESDARVCPSCGRDLTPPFSQV